MRQITNSFLLPWETTTIPTKVIVGIYRNIPLILAFGSGQLRIPGLSSNGDLLFINFSSMISKASPVENNSVFMPAFLPLDPQKCRHFSPLSRKTRKNLRLSYLSEYKDIMILIVIKLAFEKQAFMAEYRKELQAYILSIGGKG
jgi:hypothetical protein